MKPNQSPKSLYDEYKRNGRWEESVPADLIPPVEHLRHRFNTAHWKCGQITRILCFSQLHQDVPDNEAKEYVRPLMQLKVAIGSVATHRFNDLLQQGTAPAIFKAFYDLYLDGVCVQALDIFKDLAEIGHANERRLSSPYLEWAEAQTKHMIRSNIHLVQIWVRDVCDKHVYDPNEDIEERVHWRKWQAPALIIMKPSRYRPYDAARVWERNGADISSQWLRSFAEHYVLHLEVKLEEIAGAAVLEWAKRPRPESAIKSVSSENSEIARIGNSPGGISPNRVRQEARKQETQAMYGSWQKEYRRLKRDHPNMSDVWYSQRIARLDIAQGSSAETVRKHMKK